MELILDAILREVYGDSVVERALCRGARATPRPYELPENLERLFADKAAENLERFFADKAAAAVPAATVCCSPAEQSTCCEAECCGTATGTRCGCR